MIVNLQKTSLHSLRQKGKFYLLLTHTDKDSFGGEGLFQLHNKLHDSNCKCWKIIRDTLLEFKSDLRELYLMKDIQSRYLCECLVFAIAKIKVVEFIHETILTSIDYSRYIELLRIEFHACSRQLNLAIDSIPSTSEIGDKLRVKCHRIRQLINLKLQ